MKDRITVDAVLPSFVLGGSERVVLNLLNGLPTSRFDVRILTLNPTGPLEDFARSTWPVIGFDGRRLRTALPSLVTRIRRRRPKVLFCSQLHLNIALLLASGLLPGTRIFVREANMPSLCLQSGHWPRGAGLLYRFALRRAWRVAVTSSKMADEFKQNLSVPVSRLTILPNPVDCDRIRAAIASPERKPGVGRRFVAVGRLVHQKGFDRLLTWFQALDPEDRLTIIGDGPERSALEARAESLGLQDRILFAGSSLQPWSALAGADALLMPSRWEGMPNVALESLECGTPVIATEESGGLADVRREAKSGAVQICADPEAFIAQMRAIVPTKVDEPRPSLMPSTYAASTVCRDFAIVLEEAAT